MRSNTRYDQVVIGRVPPTWQDSWQAPRADPQFLADRGGARTPIRGIPAAQRNYSSDKPIQPAMDESWYLDLTDNSFYGNSPHWQAPWLRANRITSPLPPPYPWR